MTDSPICADPDSANAPLRPVMMMKLINMVLAEVKNRNRRPSRSTLVAAAMAHRRFQTFRQAEIRVWSVTDLTPTELSTRGR